MFSVLIMFILTAFPAFSKNMTILVQPFSNEGSKDFSWVSSGMTSTVISDLTSLKSINVVSDDDRKRALEELSLAQSGIIEESKAGQIGNLLGADLILSGSYIVSGNSIRVNSRILNVSTGKVEKALKIDGSLNDLFVVQDKIVIGMMENAGSVKIANVTGPVFTDKDKDALAKQYRPSKKAFELYSKGLQQIEKNSNEALEYFQKSIAEDNKFVDAYCKAGIVAGLRLSRFSEGLTYYEKAMQLFQISGDSTSDQYCNALRSIGNIYFSKGDGAEALKVFLSAQQILNVPVRRDSEEYAMLLNDLGKTYIKLKDVKKGLGYFDEAKVSLEKNGKEKSGAYRALLSNQADYYRKVDPDKAIQYYLKVFSIMSELKIKRSQSYGTLFKHMVSAYVEKKDYDHALEFIVKARDVFDSFSIKDTSHQAELFYLESRIYREKKEFDKALPPAIEALKIIEKLKMQKTEDYVYRLNDVGVAYQNLEKHQEAVDYLTKAEAVMKDISSSNDLFLASISYSSAKSWEALGDKKKAGSYYRKSYNLYVKTKYTGNNLALSKKNAERLGF